MDIANKIQEKLKKILEKLKSLGVVQEFKLEINFCDIENSLKRSLVEIDSILKKCMKKILSTPKKAEIRNIISELVRKKNFNCTAHDTVTGTSSDSLSTESLMGNVTVPATVLTFHCGFCNEAFNSKKEFVLHRKKHRYSDKYLCDRCGQFFCNFKRWQEHLEEYNEKSVKWKNFRPDFENKMITNEVAKEVQIKDVTDESSVREPTTEDKLTKSDNHVTINKEKFICSCGKVFNTFKTFRKHEKLKHSVENVKFSCLTCGKSFLEKGKLNRHMLSHKESQYQCSLCSRQFSRCDTLKRHMSLFHSKSGEFLCRFCQKKFKLKFNRDVHEENIHKNVDNWLQCQLCGRKLRNKITLKSHLKTHAGNRIKCTRCSKSFSRKTHYKSHMINRHPSTSTS